MVHLHNGGLKDRYMKYAIIEDRPKNESAKRVRAMSKRD